MKFDIYLGPKHAPMIRICNENILQWIVCIVLVLVFVVAVVPMLQKVK